MRISDCGLKSAPSRRRPGDEGKASLNPRAQTLIPQSLFPDSRRAPLFADLRLVGHAPDLFRGEAVAEASGAVGDLVGGGGHDGDRGGKVARLDLVGRVGDGAGAWEVGRLVLKEGEAGHALGPEG